MNQQVYIMDCFQKRLFPLMFKLNYTDDDSFLPHLATSHYATTVIDYFSFTSEYCNSTRKIPKCARMQTELKSFKRKCNRQYAERPKEPKTLHGFIVIRQKLGKWLRKCALGSQGGLQYFFEKSVTKTRDQQLPPLQRSVKNNVLIVSS